jgi:hypothetical protein
MGLLGLCQILTKKNSFWNLAWHHLQFSAQTCYYCSLFCFDVCYNLSAEAENCYLFLARASLVCTFSACWEWEDLLQFGILGSIPQSVVEFSYHGIYYLLQISARLECISDSSSNPTYRNQLFAALEFRESFCRLPTCMFNKCHRLGFQILITLHFSWGLLHNILFVWEKATTICSCLLRFCFSDPDLHITALSRCGTNTRRNPATERFGQSECAY